MIAVVRTGTACSVTLKQKEEERASADGSRLSCRIVASQEPRASPPGAAHCAVRLFLISPTHNVAVALRKPCELAAALLALRCN